MDILENGLKDDIVSNILFSVNEDEVEDPQIEPCTIKRKKAIFALQKLRSYINEDLFKPLSYLENKIENIILNKHKQLTLDQFFKNNIHTKYVSRYLCI